MNRRAFLKVASASLVAAVLPGGLTKGKAASIPPTARVEWPALLPVALPQLVRDVLSRTQRMEISQAGLLTLQEVGGKSEGEVPLRRTQWNQEKCTPLDRMLTDYPWGIVLHWYGEPAYFDKTITGYLRGFDSLRNANDYITRTSAHFLVGEAAPVPQAMAKEDVIGILQTQAPDQDGTPFVASHLRPLNYKLHRERQQYFVKALDALEYADPHVHSILQDFFDGAKIDPGWRTIAIEITGFDFDDPGTTPDSQQMANVLGVIWAVMKRYKISALDILGHNEIELDKPDPGKLFMASIRYLLGVKALSEPDEQMKELVFGRFLGESGNPKEAVRRYFKFVRDYLVLVSRPAQVYAWEINSQYWLLCDKLPGNVRQIEVATSFSLPLEGKISLKGDSFSKPEAHGGVDLFPDREQASRVKSGTSEVMLAARGECLYAGKNQGQCAGKMAIFRHRLKTGAEMLTLYTHLSELTSLQTGEIYPQGHVLGKIASPQVFMERFLHFAVAYGSTWETDLYLHKDLPLNAGREWILDRFVEPIGFLKDNVAG